MRHIVQVEGPSWSEDDWIDVEVELTGEEGEYIYKILGSWRWGETEFSLNERSIKDVEREICRDILRTNKVALKQVSA